MRIRLDEDQWEVDDTFSLLEILAQISDKAQAQQRLVTSLSVGGKQLTDRDLQPALLSRIGPEIGAIQAISQAMEDIMVSAEEPLQRFQALVRRQGEALTDSLRSGMADVRSVDEWLGMLADYVEATEMRRGLPGTNSKYRPISSWVEPLLDARNAGDVVRLADILEYELLPSFPERT